MDSQGQVLRFKKVEYSPVIGMVFIFNLIVGTGALAMPKAFSTAGWAIGIVVIAVVAFLSYVTATFIIETMSHANALLKIEALKKNEEPVAETVDPLLLSVNRNESLREADALEHYDETTSLLKPPLSHQEDLFEIQEVIEMGSLAKMFFNKIGYNLFYLCIVVYLFGDLAIYSAAVPMSLRDVTCTFFPNVSDYSNSSNSSDVCPNLEPIDLCWSSVSLTRIDVYRIYVAGFVLLLGPFVYFNLQKTKYLQIVTSLLRWIAFLTMLVLVIQKLARKEGTGNPPAASPLHIPNLFGICVYAFMCHHSLPQMVTPVKPKRHIYKLFAANYSVILLFYCLLSLTGIFCFSEIYDLYTLNFQPSKCPSSTYPSNVIVSYAFIQYFLALFPVFTISTSFPIVGITLRNNLLHIFGCGKQNTRQSKARKAIEKILFPSIVLIVPTLVALTTSDIQFLVGLTGSYAGAFIQYIVPGSLVILARYKVSSLRLDVTSMYESPFKHRAWPVLVFIWSTVCFVVVTINNIFIFAKGNGS